MSATTPAPGGLRVGFAAGVTPDKWARRWAARRPRSPLDLVPLAGRDGIAMLRSRDLAMCFVRLPVDTTDLHLIPLYDEQPVVVASVDHPVAAYDEIDVSDLTEIDVADLTDELADEQPQVSETDLRGAVGAVAAGTGILVLPLSLARLHHRRDVVHVPVTGVPVTTVGLAWLRDAGDERVETFVGVVRGRTANSSRHEKPAAKKRHR